jgi:aspartate kinase
MIVMKFGGSSVEDAAAIRNATQIISGEILRGPLVVVSACAGITDELTASAHDAAAGRGEEAISRIIQIQNRHFAIADRLFSKQARDAVESRLFISFAELTSVVKSVAVLRELTPQIQARILSFGELWSSLLLAETLVHQGMNAQWIDARTIVETNEEFSEAAPLLSRIQQNAQKSLMPMIRRGTIVITQGYIGATSGGLSTTLGRGGSDYSAAILGAVLNAEEIQIWTDADGILTADPALIPGARTIEELSFENASTLAYFGAKVLHPKTLLPAIEKNIPVRVLNSQNPAGKNTRIVKHSDSQDHAIQSIAYKKNVAMVTLRRDRSQQHSHILSQVLDIFKRHKKTIDGLTLTENEILLATVHTQDLEIIASEIKSFSDVRIDKDKTLCSLVGARGAGIKRIAALSILDSMRIPVYLISEGTSNALLFVVDTADMPAALAAVHDNCFGPRSSVEGYLFNELEKSA